MRAFCMSCKHRQREYGKWACRVDNCMHLDTIVDRYDSKHSLMEQQTNNFKVELDRKNALIIELEQENYRYRHKNDMKHDSMEGL